MTSSNQHIGTHQPRPGERVAELLSEQRDLYRQLARLSERQRGLITGDEPERLLALLSERQQLIDRLESIGVELRPYQANWRQVRAGLTDDEGRRVDGLLGEVNAILSEILKQDEADTALLSARKNQTQQQIGTIQTGRQVGRAYASTYSAQASGGGEWTSA